VIEGGYTLKVLRVDLTRRKAKVQPVSERFAVWFVGGRGWGAKILYDEVESGVDAFSPENKIVVASGPLSGLIVPCSGKTSFSTISPATGLYGDSNVGGEFSCALKRSGFDALIIEGSAEKPVILAVDDGNVMLKDASHIWGMPSLDAEKAVKDELGKDFHTAVIGPAGENLVKFAAVNCDFGRQAARCGVGAVMGSKKLKAIAVRGSKAIPAANPDRLKETYKETVAWMIKHPAFDLWKRQGTMQSIDWANELSCLPTRNFQEAQYEEFKKINGDTMESLTRLHNKGCYLCPIRCGQVNQVEGTVVEGPEYETAVMLGSNCALPSIEDVVYANYLCDQLGLDTISTGNTVAFAMECYEKGYLDREDTGGIKLKFGSSEALNETIKKIAYREGIGSLLAEGVEKASQAVGHGSERFAMHVKGLEVSGYDVRGAPAMGLSYATSDIGAHHNRAWAITYDIKTDRKSYGEDKVKWVIYLQHIRPLFDCLGVCRFPWVELGLNADYYAEFYTYATGVKASLEELLKGSERVWNLTRLINLKRGLKAEDDWLPPRVFEDGIPSGPLKGLTLSREKFRWMVEKYYELRGWSENGVPTEAKLGELGLLDSPSLSS